MRYEHQTAEKTLVYGVGETSEFNVSQNGKIFRILISGLYTNKINSIVREAAANAWDGHVYAGKEKKKFIVHCPTEYEPWFSVRDFGCSMTHETVMRNYQTLGFSTKEQSDKETGTFGLGAKAPFSYVSVFTVTAVLNGEKRIYMAYDDVGDHPKISLTEISKTDEENGIEVSFPVEKKDIEAFARAVKIAALGHDVGFECNIQNVEKIKIKRKLKNCKIIDDNNKLLMGNGPYFKLGVIIYPFDSTQRVVQDALAKKNRAFVDYLMSSLGNDLLIDFPLEENPVPLPSREALDYRTDMIEKTVDKIESAFKELMKEIDEEINKCEKQYEYWGTYEKLMGSKISVFQKHYLNNIETIYGKIKETKSLLIPAELKHESIKWLSLFRVLENGKSRLKPCRDALSRGNILIVVDYGDEEKKIIQKLKYLIEKEERNGKKNIDIYVVKRVTWKKLVRMHLSINRNNESARKYSKLKELLKHAKRIESALNGVIRNYAKDFINYDELESPPIVKKNRGEKNIIAYTSKSGTSLSKIDMNRVNLKQENILLMEIKNMKTPEYMIGSGEILSILRRKNLRYNNIICVSSKSIGIAKERFENAVVFDDLLAEEVFSTENIKTEMEKYAEIVFMKEMEKIIRYNNLYYNIIEKSKYDFKRGDACGSLVKGIIYINNMREKNKENMNMISMEDGMKMIKFLRMVEKMKDENLYGKILEKLENEKRKIIEIASLEEYTLMNRACDDYRYRSAESQRVLIERFMIGSVVMEMDKDSLAD